MKCMIANRCVKLFGRSIHCLSRIGDELFLEALKDGLALRTVNSSRSAYACFHFKESFFTEYSQDCDQIHSSDDATDMLKCKISMKSVLGIFRSLATIEKTVEQCKVEFKPTECRLIFTLFCRHGITKTHNLTYQECESLQAVFTKELCPNLIQTQARVLQDTVSNFPNSCEEISFRVYPDSLKVKNYVDDEPDPSKIVHTEMTLAPEEFENFQIGIDTVITFCLKELRAVLSFCEFVNQPMSLHFGQTGHPIVFAIDSDVTYCGDFVMATLSESETTSQQTKINDETNQLMTNNSTTRQLKKRKTNPTPPIANNKEGNTNNRHHEGSDQSVPNKKSANMSSSSSSYRKTTVKSDGIPAQQNTIKSNNRSISNVKSNGDQQINDDFFTDSFPYHEDMLVDTSNTAGGTPSIKKSHVNINNNSKLLNTSILRSNCSTVNSGDNNIADMSLGEEFEDDILLCTPPPPQTQTQRRRAKNFFSAYKEVPNETTTTTTKASNALLASDTDDEED